MWYPDSVLPQAPFSTFLSDHATPRNCVRLCVCGLSTIPKGEVCVRQWLEEQRAHSKARQHRHPVAHMRQLEHPCGHLVVAPVEDCRVEEDVRADNGDPKQRRLELKGRHG